MNAGIHDTIDRLAQGYETILSRWLTQKGNHGTELSGGEWQKIAIARLFIRNANLLILDEPMSSLDAQAEHDIYERFVHLTTERTSVLISHRYNTVRTVDIIAVLENGTITDYGSHDELMRLGKSYTKLYSIQAERYR